MTLPQNKPRLGTGRIPVSLAIGDLVPPVVPVSPAYLARREILRFRVAAQSHTLSAFVPPTRATAQRRVLRARAVDRSTQYRVLTRSPRAQARRQIVRYRARRRPDTYEAS